ncbi:YlzJ-like family protein [Ornithinibacillus contaminans]|uniref:YlzJ-like family protein n=1 Tax=Ornithinibacillus contaminans TaxID=694055 RepID=UPI0009F849D9|nr:YlzJ-like family protein [Ornithinibacillus contaminans]
MILYTPLAETDIFPIAADAYTNRVCINYGGKQVYVEKNSDGAYRLLQLLSTDPQDFLNENYTPGTIIS